MNVATRDTATRSFTAREVAVAAVLLVAHYTLAYTATFGSTTTFDEVLHIVAGVSYWTLDDYRLQPENGNLPQRWAALPLLLTQPAFPARDTDLWRQSNAVLLGRQYLFSMGNDPDAILRVCRAMATCWSAATCLVVWLWSRSLFGTGGGLVSLLLAVWWPALVAHGPLATSDACAGLFFALGTWALWSLLDRITLGTLLAAAAAIGFAAIAKHSSVLLAPVALAFLTVTTVAGRPLRVRIGLLDRLITSRPGRLAAGLLALVVPLVAAVVCIWAACGFRYPTVPLASGDVELFRYGTLENCTEHAGGVGRICAALARWRILPEAWLYGMSYVASLSRLRNAFAIGAYSMSGWWWFFPLCLAIKNTLPALGLAGWGIVRELQALIGAWRSRSPLSASVWAAVAPLVALAVLWPTFLTSHLNIGERHLIPSYPLMMVLAGGVWPAVRGRWLSAVVLGLLALHAVDVTSRYPFSLSYFNQIVPRGREYQWLVDSSLDWGQDLPRLARRLPGFVRPGEPVYLNYFGSCRPDTVLPDAELLGLAPRPGAPQSLRPGVYCVSATSLQAVYDEPFGRWCRKFEQTYQNAREYVQTHHPAGARAAPSVPTNDSTDTPFSSELGLDDIDDEASVEAVAVSSFTLLQAGRLRAFLRHRPPDATVGGSILIFRLSAADLQRALAGPPAELDEISWMERDSGGTAATLVRQGDQRFDEGRLVEAEEALAQATRLDPNNPKAWGRLAVVHQSRGMTAKAEAAFTRAIRLGEDDPEPCYNRGLMRTEQGRLDDAIADFTEAVRRDPAYRQAWFNRGVLHLRAGRADLARRDLEAFEKRGGTIPSQIQRILDGGTDGK
jgi:tetratricopeptide (TPR) repeat protein